MGKMPLAGLISACSLGILLTGCNCCNKNSTRHAFAGGKAERGMGLFGQRPRSPSTSVPPPLDAAAGNSLNSPSSPESGASISRGSSSNGAGMMTPNSSDTMTPISSSATLSSNSSATLPLNANNANTLSSNSSATLSSNSSATLPLNANNANMISSGALPSSMSNGNAALPMVSNGGGNQFSSSTIQKVSHETGPISSTTVSDNASSLPTKASGQTSLPPPPDMSSSTPSSNGKASRFTMKSKTNGNLSSLSSPPPSPSPSDSASLLSDPPPSVSLGTSSKTSNASATTSTNSAGPSLPSYLMTTGPK